MEVEQDSVGSRMCQTVRGEPLVAEPIDIQKEKQAAYRAYELDDALQRPQIIFLLHGVFAGKIGTTGTKRGGWPLRAGYGRSRYLMLSSSSVRRSVSMIWVSLFLRFSTAQRQVSGFLNLMPHKVSSSFVRSAKETGEPSG